MTASKNRRPPPIRLIRKQAAEILRVVLKDDAQRNAQSSIKAMIYKPTVVSKKTTLALTSGVLKYFPVIKHVLESTKLLNGKNKGQTELFYLLIYEFLFGQGISSNGDAEKLVLSRKNALHAALAQLLVKQQAKSVEELLPVDPSVEVPRYVRVNTLKISVEEAFTAFQTMSDVKHDDLIPNLLLLPAGTDLHNHPLVVSGAVLLQGKASCMPACILAPESDWQVIDACAAPGNKTTHLAALMNGKGKIYACELNKSRLEILQRTVERTRASNVEILHQDFLRLDPSCSRFSKVRGILVDPSCSGSGTKSRRLDHLLPSSKDKDEIPSLRIERLSNFQKMALLHAFSFPAVKRVVYSTCSDDQRENEEVVMSVLSTANSLNFQLVSPFPTWQHRGLPVFDGAHHLLRTDAVRDKMDGFFVALFTRDFPCPMNEEARAQEPAFKNKKKRKQGQQQVCGVNNRRIR